MSNARKSPEKRISRTATTNKQENNVQINFGWLAEWRTGRLVWTEPIFIKRNKIFQGLIRRCSWCALMALNTYYDHLYETISLNFASFSFCFALDRTWSNVRLPGQHNVDSPIDRFSSDFCVVHLIDRSPHSASNFSLNRNRACIAPSSAGLTMLTGHLTKQTQTS